MPPELIWHHNERMKEHWEQVRTSRTRPGSRDEDVPSTDNELAEEYRRG